MSQLVELTLVVAGGVAGAVGVAVAARRIGIAAPLLLVALGVGISYVPGFPRIKIEPEWILAVVLPPLLYATAINMPAQDLRRDFKAITGLAVLLTAVTTAGAGWVCHAVVPGIGWPTAFAVGAIVSPTDAVAATSVGRKLGVPSRILTLLEGEGLVNDATSLTLLRSAIAAMAGYMPLWQVFGHFCYSVLVAVVVGALIGYVGVRIRSVVGDVILASAISIAVPFVAFVPAEDLGASGVLAVVVAGVVTGHEGLRHLTAEARLTQSVNWRTLAFLLESFVFLYMGLQLKHLINDVSVSSFTLTLALVSGLILTAAVIGIRIAFVAPLVAMLHRDARRAAKQGTRLERIREWRHSIDSEAFGIRRLRRIDGRIARAESDIEFALQQRLGWRGGVVLAWAGMRGAITVAAVHTLPDSTAHREQLMLIAYVVAAATLLLQGGTLPAVIRALKIEPDDPERLQREFTDLLTDMQRAGATAIGDPAVVSGYPPEVISRVRYDSRIATEAAETEASHSWGGTESRKQYRRLRLKVITAQRDELLSARAIGKYSSETLRSIERQLDVEEAALTEFIES